MLDCILNRIHFIQTITGNVYLLPLLFQACLVHLEVPVILVVMKNQTVPFHHVVHVVQAHPVIQDDPQSQDVLVVQLLLFVLEDLLALNAATRYSFAISCTGCL